MPDAPVTIGGVRSQTRAMRLLAVLATALLLPPLVGTASSNSGPQQQQTAQKKTTPEQEFNALGQKAEQGDSSAQYHLGEMYANGRGVPRDDAQAVVWYRKAAEQGNSWAMIALGDMYAKGRGVPQDAVQAAAWRKAGEQKGVTEMISAAMAAAERQIAIERDPAALRAEAERGVDWAQYDLGLMYEKGRGVPQSDMMAAIWYRRAAEQGHTQAQYGLGEMYSKGRGVPQDYEEAHMWANLAASFATGEDQKKYLEARDSLARLMTPAQLAEAQKRAQAWKPSWLAGVSSSATSTEPVVDWRRAAPPPTSIVQLGPADRNPSPKLDMFERSAAAVAGLRGSRGTGTAVLISRDGLALTNHHVVDNQGALTATLRDGRQLAVRVLRSNPEADVALIQVNCSSDCFTLDSARSTPRVGTEVHVIGNPLALDYTLTRGIVSGLRLAGGVTLVQTDAAINPGNSGGPIIDAKTREVVAIVSLKATAQGAEGLGFGVAIADALRVLGIQWQ